MRTCAFYKRHYIHSHSLSRTIIHNHADCTEIICPNMEIRIQPTAFEWSLHVAKQFSDGDYTSLGGFQQMLIRLTAGSTRWLYITVPFSANAYTLLCGFPLVTMRHYTAFSCWLCGPTRFLADACTSFYVSRLMHILHYGVFNSQLINARVYTSL